MSLAIDIQKRIIRREITKADIPNEYPNIIENLDDLYSDSTFYSSPDMFSPPSERLEHVIRFELTNGCDWGRCTYCGGYDGIKYRSKSLEEYKEHVDTVWEKITKESMIDPSRFRRIFIGGGNALAVDFETLVQAITYTTNQFRKYTRNFSHRTAIYGRTQSILEKGKNQLKRLYNGKPHWYSKKSPRGLDLIYWGVESGSTNVLEYVNKGCSKEDIIKAGQIINATAIGTSVMIMPGLGGIKLFEQHAKETAEVLNEIKPSFLTFMGINPAPNSAYARRMKREIEEGTNRPLTDIETADQIIRILEKLTHFRRGMRVGSFEEDVDGVGYNPLTFRERFYESVGKEILIEDLKGNKAHLIKIGRLTDQTTTKPISC